MVAGTLRDLNLQDETLLSTLADQLQISVADLKQALDSDDPSAEV